MKVGDKVLYVGNKEGKAQNTDLLGRSGVIKHLYPEIAILDWDNWGEGPYPYLHNLILHKDHYIQKFKELYAKV